MEEVTNEIVEVVRMVMGTIVVVLDLPLSIKISFIVHVLRGQTLGRPVRILWVD